MRDHTTGTELKDHATTPQQRPEATVVITTKNRKEDLRTALASTLTQIGARIEVIVIDDGSTDGTAAMVREQFPSVRLVTESCSAGYIVRRNQAAHLATAPIIFSIDDDAAFASPRTVHQTLADFDSPEVGAVAIPFINVNQDSRLRQSVADADETHAIFAYIGTSHAIRRDVFLALGGYRELFFHQGEEMDLCIRMLDKGLFVRVGHADPIHHFESPRRDNRRIPIYSRRNDILFTVLNVPFVFLPLHLAATSFNGLRAGLRRGQLMWSLEGLARGYVTALCNLGGRQPVRLRTYRDFRLLKRQETAPVSALASLGK